MGDSQFITLETENGEEIRYGVLAIFSLNNMQYIALIPVRDNDQPADAEVSLYGYVLSDDGSDYDIYRIEDKDRYTAVARAFEKVVAAVSNE